MHALHSTSESSLYRFVDFWVGDMIDIENSLDIGRVCVETRVSIYARHQLVLIAGVSVVPAAATVKELEEGVINRGVYHCSGMASSV